MRRRTDVPQSAVTSSSIPAIVTEWLGRVAALISILLFALVLVAIHKGLAVQQTSRQIVRDFHVANDLFAKRADFAAAGRAKGELQRLTGVLTTLNQTAADDVGSLSATVPDVKILLAAGRGDVNIAGQLQGIGGTLQNSAVGLNHIAGGANTSVSTVNNDLSTAMGLTQNLNDQLSVTEQKLSVLPSTGR